MISFDDVNFQYEEEGTDKRVVIIVNNARELNDDEKYEIRKYLEAVFNG